MYNHKLDAKVLFEMIMMMSERREKKKSEQSVSKFKTIDYKA